MVAVVLGMLFCVALALAVMALVAVPARRAGRDVLTERGEQVVGSIRDRQAASATPPGTPVPAPVDEAVGARA